MKVDAVEDTQNPLVVQANSSVKNEVPGKEESEKVSKEKEVEVKKYVSKARDIAGVVNKFLEDM